MYKSRAVYSYAHRVLCIVLAVVLFDLLSCSAFATSGVPTPVPIDRYNGLANTVLPYDDEGGMIEEVETSEGDLAAVNKSKEDIDVEEFNGSFLDTVIYVIGGICALMMLLQITAFTICKLYPSWNHIIAKLHKIGISGYEDGWIVPTIKILLLGILGYLCISGTMKHLVAYILGWYTNLVQFN